MGIIERAKAIPFSDRISACSDSASGLPRYPDIRRLLADRPGRGDVLVVRVLLLGHVSRFTLAACGLIDGDSVRKIRTTGRFVESDLESSHCYLA